MSGLRDNGALVTLEKVDPSARVLVVTSGWPHASKPTQCVFIQRQMDSLGAFGVRYETMFVRGYRSKRAYMSAALRLLLLNFCRRGYDLVHCHGGEVALAACFYRRAPVLVSYLGGDLLYDSLRDDGAVSVAGRLRCWVIRAHSVVAAATITKSAEMERALPRRARVHNRVIPNGVDTGLFRPIERADARSALGWKDDERVILFAADPAEKRKRYSLAAAAVERANAMLGNVRLVVASCIEPNDMPVYMNAADCLVHVSRMEGSPNVLKEALMCNLPIVATSVGDVPELLDGVEPSFIVEPDEFAVAQALIQCVATPTRSNGRRKAAELGSTVIAERVSAIYRQLAPRLDAP